MLINEVFDFFFSSRRRHTRLRRDWSSDVCSSDLVGYPISLSRGAYWLGRTYEKMGNRELSEKWYKEGAKYLTTYYGQLSHLKVYPNQKFALYNSMQVEGRIG